MGRSTRLKAPRKYLDEGQVKTLLATPYPKDERDRLLLQYLLVTGTRRSEAAGLVPDDLNLADFTVNVHGKGSYERVVPLPPQFQGELVRYIQVHGIGPQAHVFGLDTGKAVGDVVKKYVDRGGLPAWVSAHNLRHTFAVQSIKAGRDLRTLQKDLGHASLETTAVYLDIIPEDRVNTHLAHPLPWDARLDAYLKGQGGQVHG